MPQWKTQLHKDMRMLGHKLAPIKRTSSRVKGKSLSEIDSQYQTHCQHCKLTVAIATVPSMRAIATLRVEDYNPPATPLPFSESFLAGVAPTCTLKRFGASIRRDVLFSSEEDSDEA